MPKGDVLATGVFCTECKFFEDDEVDRTSWADRCLSCGCPESKHVAADIIAK
jgi:hypothetical protein